MNRITYHKKNGEFGIAGVDITTLGNLLYAAVCKLKDYEDTGMSPGEIKRMIDNRDKKPVTNYEHIKSIADHYGIQAQLMQTIEECAELIQAINKYFRAVDGAGQPTTTTAEQARNNLVEEIADVSVMIEQLAYLFNSFEEVKQTANDKLNRTIERQEIY